MRRSFVRLVIGSVLSCWAIGFVVLFTFAQTHIWSDDDLRTNGVFLAHELIDATEPRDRPRRLAELTEHFSVPLSIVAVDEVERRVGPLAPPQKVYRVQRRLPLESEFFLPLTDGSAALAVGPLNPANPTDRFPIGLMLAILGLPMIAGLIALRVERQLRTVERATEELATGELGARVDDESGNELAESFNVMADRVERLVRSRDELVQAISHELGSPLSRLRFRLETLKDASGAESPERVDAMARELDALDALVAELLGYVQADDVEPQLRAFEPHRALADLVELARLESTSAPTVELDLEDGVAVSADARLFQRAVENVLRNAVQHAGRRVRLELASAGEQVRITVHDDGPGIPEAQREQVLVPFSRLQADRGRKTGGVGLGLAIVTRVVERHGGCVEITSSPLGGASVCTVWPRG